MEPEAASEASEPQPAPSAFILRAAEPTDLAFIASSWRRNYDSAENTRCPGGIFEYIETQGAVIEQCLRTSHVTVACPPERPEQILGWCCYRKPATLHYVYVKPYYRGAGIGRALIEEAVFLGVDEDLLTWRTVYTTHSWRRPHGEGIGVIVGKARTAGITVQYNPALIFGGKR